MSGVGSTQGTYLLPIKNFDRVLNSSGTDKVEEVNFGSKSLAGTYEYGQSLEQPMISNFMVGDNKREENGV